MKTIFLVAIFTIAYVVCMDLVNKYMSSMSFETISENQIVEEEKNVFSVSISGCVVNPGTYTVVKNSDLGYLISLAGGITSEADLTSFNSGAILIDGENYYISSKRSDDKIKVSLNNATQAQLDSLPGIGEVFAKRIIEYRISNGSFKTIEELKNVKGIGYSLYDSLKDLVCL